MSIVPPPVPSEAFTALASELPLTRSVPPVNTAVEPTHESAPDVFATNVAPLTSMPLPLPHIPGEPGLLPAAIVPSEVSRPVAGSTENIDTLLLPLEFVAYRVLPSGLNARPTVVRPLATEVMRVFVAASMMLTEPTERFAV